MQLVYNIYTMSIDRYSVIEKTKDYSMFSRIWLPKFILTKKWESFQKEIDELFQNKNVMDNDILRLTIYNHINILSAVHMGLGMAKIPELLQEFEERFHKKFKGAKDLKLITKEIKRLVSKYKELEQKNPDGKNYDFESIVSNVEMTLGRELNRSMTLFQFKYKYDQASSIIAANQNK